MILYGKNEFSTEFLLENEQNIYTLLNFAEKYGITGNLPKAKIAWIIMNDENPFSLSAERNDGSGSAATIARKDIAELRKLFLSPADDLLQNYTPLNKNISGEEKRIGNIVMSFAKELDKTQSDEEFFLCVKNFYVKHGVGAFGINKAFYMQDDGALVAVSHIKETSFEELFGYETQKQRLIENTKAFAEGKSANNVLLYGDSGTGKSTSIKSVLNMFYDKGIRMIQIQKHQFIHLNSLTEKLKKRNYRFVLYMDDLSFEDFEVEYKYLKAAIEGGLEEKPENVLIYATSNRRHLIKETFGEREADDIHRNETVQEKISLSDRFGLQIYYPKPEQQQFFDMVIYLAERDNLQIDKEELIFEARKWGVSHGGFSGRTAKQFILHLKTK